MPPPQGHDDCVRRIEARLPDRLAAGSTLSPDCDAVRHDHVHRVLGSHRLCRDT
jgi:hypothetical protein